MKPNTVSDQFTVVQFQPPETGAEARTWTAFAPDRSHDPGSTVGGTPNTIGPVYAHYLHLAELPP